jgi:hypothetical protein
VHDGGQLVVHICQLRVERDVTVLDGRRLDDRDEAEKEEH